MAEKSKSSRALALEFMPTGLSLITFEDDTPIECLAHVANDDPEREAKLGTFRDCAEAALGKGFKTQIWMSDEDVRLHCAMLGDGKDNEREEKAISALVAMTAFNTKDLCFDLGATDAEGYTPIAAIQKEKMDNALAFAKTYQLNPAGVTTSDDVAGFATRPTFRVRKPANKAAAPVRAAGVAALLAIPFIGWSGGWFDNLMAPLQDTASPMAFVASVERSALPGEALDLVFPSSETAINRPFIDLSAVDTPDQDAVISSPPLDTGVIVSLVQAVQLPAIGLGELDSPHLRSVTYSDSMPSLPKFGHKPVAMEPEYSAISPSFVDEMPSRIFGPEPIMVADIQIYEAERYVRADAPQPMFSAHNTRLDIIRPKIKTAANQPIEFTNIRDAAARDEVSEPQTVVPSPGFRDAFAVQVANIAEGILVTKPPARTRELVLQPSFSFVPTPRPGAKLPEEAFDFSTLVPLTAPIQDSAPSAQGVDDQVTSFGPAVSLSTPAFDTPMTIGDDVRGMLMVIAAARADEADALAIPRPVRRDASPGPNLDGAIIQTEIREVLAPDGQELLSVSVEPTADVVPGFLAAAPLQALALDTDATRAAEPVDVSALIASLPAPPVRPFNQADADETPGGISEALAPPTADAEVVVTLSDGFTLPRPPVRPGVEAEVASAAETTEVEQGDLATIEGADEVPGITDPEVSEALAEVAIEALTLVPPPSRPKAIEQVAILTDPDAEFASPQAVPLAVLPISRPADLSARAAKIRANRTAVAVAPTTNVTPGTTTPGNSLRLPSSAEVARAATIENGINLGGVSLIGIFGTANARRALVRLPQGRYVQVKRGDKVRGWTVSAISENNVRVQKGSQNSILRMPQ